VWPRYKNISSSKWKTDFIAVGIGPLCYDAPFVPFSDEPADVLKSTGDLFFLAKQTKFVYLILPTSTKAELKLVLLNDFILTFKPTIAGNIDMLAEQVPVHIIISHLSTITVKKHKEKRRITKSSKNIADSITN